MRSYETHARVEHYVTMFTRNGTRAEFTEWLERGTRYDAMIRSKLRAGGIPEDMTYLALVESGYDPNAYSRAAAVGMWQFMTSTARDLGLRVEWWVDERRDPVRSTDAAIRHIRWLQKQFGSLYLAAAAYNGGEGRVSRGLTQFAAEMVGTEGDDRFFALAEKDYLYAETKNYVPQIIAAALVAKEPAKYGIVVRPRAPLAYDSVPVPAATPLTAVAKAAGVPLAEIIDLNPQMLRGMTPPASAYTLRVPVGRAEMFAVALAALPAAEREAFRRTESKTGESVRAVAERMDASAGAIALFNTDLRTVAKGKHRGKLRAGQSIRVPTPALLAGLLDVPDPAIERRAAPKPAPKAATVTTVRHVVKRGESLGGIARKYDTSVGALRSLNGMKKSSVIKVGKSLVVRRSAAEARRPADDENDDAAPKAKSGAKSKAGAKADEKSVVADDEPSERPEARTKSKASAKTKAGAKKSTTRAGGKSSTKAGAKSKSAAGGSKSVKSAKGKPATKSAAKAKGASKSTSTSAKSAAKKSAAKKSAAKKPAARSANTSAKKK